MTLLMELLFTAYLEHLLCSKLPIEQGGLLSHILIMRLKYVKGLLPLFDAHVGPSGEGRARADFGAAPRGRET